MVDQTMRSRKAVQRGRKQQKRKKLSTRGLYAIVAAIAVVCLGVFWYINSRSVRQDTDGQVVHPSRQYTTFQEAIRAEYDAAKGTFTGERSEVDLVARYFATNVFTLWGVMSEDDYNGKDLIPEANANDFDQQMKNNLVFQFNQIVSAYGANNLPIVTSVEVEDIMASTILYDDSRYSGYTATVFMTYQDGTIEGTKNANIDLATRLLQNWAYSADLEFFWIPAETGDGGEWKLASMKGLVSNETANERANSTAL